MAVEEGPNRVIAELWLPAYNTFLLMNQQGDLLKAYAKLICSKLTAAGYSAESSKTVAGATAIQPPGRSVATATKKTDFDEISHTSQQEAPSAPPWVWKLLGMGIGVFIVVNVMGDIEDSLGDSDLAKGVLVLSAIAFPIAIATMRSNNQKRGNEPPHKNATSTF